MKFLYLDQNFWIRLARVHYGFDTNQLIKKCCTKLQELVSNEKLLCPISIANFSELHTVKDKEKSKRLGEFMFLLSKGYCMLPAQGKLLRWEVINAMLSELRKPKLIEPNELSQLVVAQGIFTLVGRSGTLKGDVPEETKKTILKKLNSAEMVNYFLTTPLDAKKDNEYSKTMEPLRQHMMKIKDKTRRHYASYADYFTGVIVPILVDIEKYGWIFRQQFASFDKGAMIAFLKKIPSAYCEMELSHGRNADLGRPIKDNDLNDILGLSVAIPYCDIVAAERMFISIAKRAKLSELYETELVSTFEELSICLDEI